MKTSFWSKTLGHAGILMTVGTLALGTACGPHVEPVVQTAKPEAPKEDWKTGTPSEQGIDEAAVRSVVEQIRSGGCGNIHSFLLVRNGVLVCEAYFPGAGLFGEPSQAYDKDTLHRAYSVSKSVTSALMGIAVGEGRLKGVDEPVVSFFPEYSELAGSPDKGRITVRNLLTMTAGLAWDEESLDYDDPGNSHCQMDKSGDPIRFVLNRPLVSNPGDHWVYNSGLSMVLGAVLRATTGKRADEYAAEKLFAPLGITQFQWDRYENGTVQTGGGLKLRPRDMAKLGQLFLNGGRWGTQQVLPATWIDESTRKQAADFNYGYQWWVANNGAAGGPPWTGYMAIGIGGQYIFVVPSLSLVAVFTGGNLEPRLAIQPQILMTEKILPAVQR